MGDRTQLFATRLPAGLFTLPWTMTLLLTFVSTTSECLATDVSATDIGEPTWLILQHIFAAQAILSCQKRAFGTILIVTVAVVSHLRVSTVFGTLTRETTRWWLCAAW
jgi:hypothetical protein